MNEDTENEGQPKKLMTILSEKSPALSVDETVQHAGDKLRSLDADALPVAEDRRLVGMVTERHPDRRAAGHGHDPQVERVGSCMSRELIYCYEDEDREVAARIMRERGLKFLPIVDRQMRIVGMVTEKDLASAESGNESNAP